MQSLVIVDNIKHWSLGVDDVKVITAKEYLTANPFSDVRGLRVYNLCRSYKYQSFGYYVSLLAQARGHRVSPSIKTIQDLKSVSMIKMLSEDLDQLIQKSLAKLRSKEFTLSIYFGKNIAKQYEKLSAQLYNLFQTPLLHARFTFNKKWMLQNVSVIALKDVPSHHQPFLLVSARQYFSKPHISRQRRTRTTYDLAILINPEEKMPPSNQGAIKRFIHAAESIGLSTECITKNDFNKLPIFDGLFIRETTSVNHHTYRFAQRATKEGLVVIDDPESIIKCTNKVYLAELLTKAKISTPRTIIVHEDNRHHLENLIDFPLVLKQPDSSFSQGVIKVDSQDALQSALDKLFEQSDLVIAQAFVPTEFDWRIGIIDEEPIFACKYFMAKNHWQIYCWETKSTRQHTYRQAGSGLFETLPIEAVPQKVLRTALKAASLIGDGLYGVDLKQVGRDVLVIEVNDNPNIDHGIEDLILKDELYLNLANVFLKRIRQSKIPV